MSFAHVLFPFFFLLSDVPFLSLTPLQTLKLGTDFGIETRPTRKRVQITQTVRANSEYNVLPNPGTSMTNLTTPYRSLLWKRRQFVQILQITPLGAGTYR